LGGGLVFFVCGGWPVGGGARGDIGGTEKVMKKRGKDDPSSKKQYRLERQLEKKGKSNLSQGTSLSLGGEGDAINRPV